MSNKLRLRILKKSKLHHPYINVKNYSLNLNGIKVNPETLRNKHTQIAKRARLHQTTVSLILNRSRKSFKPETIDKVRDAIIDLFSNVYVVTEPAKLPNSNRVTGRK